jgi:hypothetical protein
MLSRTQGSSISLTATLACTQGSGTSLPDTLAHSYTTHCTPGPSPCIYKREVQGLHVGGSRGGTSKTNRLTLSLSLSLANACNPYYDHPLVRDYTSRVLPLCSISRQPIWAGARSDKFTRRSRDPRVRNADIIIIITINKLTALFLFDDFYSVIALLLYITSHFIASTRHAAPSRHSKI